MPKRMILIAVLLVILSTSALPGCCRCYFATLELDDLKTEYLKNYGSWDEDRRQKAEKRIAEVAKDVWWEVDIKKLRCKAKELSEGGEPGCGDH